MCGRYTLKTPVERLSEKFQFPKIIPLKPRYNIAPSQSVAVVRLLPDDTDRKLAMLRWSLLPAWVKDPAKVQQPINAKVGDVITWTNSDSVPHKVALDDGSCAMSDNIPGGGSKSLVFSAAGTFPFHCAVHPFMTGTITIS